MTDTTKTTIANSLKALLAEKPLSKITIQELADHAGISRMTFYYHFKDIYDLLEWVTEAEFARVVGKNPSYETWQDGYLELFRELQRDRPFFYNLYMSTGREKIEKYLQKRVVLLFSEVADDLTKDANVSEKKKQYVVHFFAYALVGFLLDWVENGMSTPPEEIVSTLANLFRGEFKRVLLTGD